jgi:glyoxylase-like metal-dependent hydrolase (beta-lactamase superfamily II)
MWWRPPRAVQWRDLASVAACLLLSSLGFLSGPVIAQSPAGSSAVPNLSGVWDRKGPIPGRPANVSPVQLAQLVDAMYERNHDQVIALVKTVTSQPIKYIVNTHHHADHTNGNQRFLPDTTIVAHENARANMGRGPDPMPGPPSVTYATEAAIHVGNAEVQLHHLV